MKPSERIKEILQTGWEKSGVEAIIEYLDEQYIKNCEHEFEPFSDKPETCIHCETHLNLEEILK